MGGGFTLSPTPSFQFNSSIGRHQKTISTSQRATLYLPCLLIRNASGQELSVINVTFTWRVEPWTWIGVLTSFCACPSCYPWRPPSIKEAFRKHPVSPGTRHTHTQQLGFALRDLTCQSTAEVSPGNATLEKTIYSKTSIRTWAPWLTESVSIPPTLSGSSVRTLREFESRNNPPAIMADMASLFFARTWKSPIVFPNSWSFPS